MAWVEERLSEAGLLGWGHPDRENLFAWTEEVLANNGDILSESVRWRLDRGWTPETVNSFEELVLELIITEGGL